jgi:hypothetical protein
VVVFSSKRRKNKMARLSRRTFFKQTTASVATMGLLGAAPILTSDPEGPEAAATELSTSTAELAEPMVAHVRDLATGEVSLMVGSQEIIYRDPELVMRLLRAAR